jgi:glycosyltransferase involved in cell wall biosynthesis
MEYRPFYLAREWVRAGHTVQIVAATYSHVRAVQPDGAGDESIDGIAYRWLATPAYHGNGVGRARNIATFLARLWRLAPALATNFKPDVVIASSTYPMDIWVAHRIAKLTRRQGTPSRLVFEVHDLWPLSPIELGGMSQHHPFIMLCQAAENDAYRHADVVVSMLPMVAQHMQSHGLDLHKLHIVPNGVDPGEWELAEPLPPELVAQFAAWQNQGEKIVGYAGSHGVANALDDLLDAARLMRDDKLRFVLVGTGPEKERLRQRARNMGLDNVSFLAPVCKAQIPALLKLFDIAYLGLQDQPLFRFGIAPNKLMDYMMAERPVLMAIRAGNDPVAESGCGISVPPADPQAIAQGLRRLLALDAATRARMGALGRQFVLENHVYPVLAQRFLAVVSIAGTAIDYRAR